MEVTKNALGGCALLTVPQIELVYLSFRRPLTGHPWSYCETTPLLYTAFQ